MAIPHRSDSTMSLSTVLASILLSSTIAFILPTKGTVLPSKLIEQHGASVRLVMMPAHLLRPPTRLSINLNSNDAFEILGLNASPNLDKKEIKRAYKRMAVKYHPDVVTNQSSTPAEKRKASDIFAKINWAYATLSGKNQDEKGSSSSSSSTKSSSTSAGGYTPPHRRSSTSTTSSDTSYSSDWRDYMPKYEDIDYDTGGDSFGSIFSDLISGVAGAAAAGGGREGSSIFRDFIEFLEGNDMAGGNDDASLNILLQTGSIQDIANEMDDTELVVQQLSSKLSNVEEEFIIAKADMKVTTRYMEKLALEERMDELEARKKVVQGYIKKARKRLLAIQTRYRDLIVGGANDSRAGGRSASAANSESSSSSSYSTSTSSTSDSTAQGPSGSTPNDEDAWKNQGFGSTGRRGSGRRRRDPTTSSQRGSTAQTPPPPRQEVPRTSSSRPSESATRSTTTSLPTGNSSWEPPVPPHRRTAPPQDDKRRLRELQVNDEFEKLKKELGL